RPAGQAGTAVSAAMACTGFNEETIAYDWQVTESVAPPNLTVGAGQTGYASYQVCGLREIASDTRVTGVRGQVCLDNTGNLTTQGLTVVAQVECKAGPGPFQPLPGASQTISGYELLPGESRCVAYEVDFVPPPGGMCRGVAHVTITNHSGHLGTAFGP